MDPSSGVYHISSKSFFAKDCFVAKYNANNSINFAQGIIYQTTIDEEIIGLESIDTSTFVLTAKYTGNGLNLDPKNHAPSNSLGTFYAGVFAKFTGGLNNLNVSVNSPDTVESCKLSATITATSNNNNYSYFWYKNGTLIANEISATINRTDAGTFQCLVRNNNSQQWSKKLLFNILTNYLV
jgi:hypothetical protein